MRLELKRIEATLQQVAAQNAANGELPSSLEHYQKKEQLSSSIGEAPKKELQDPLSALKIRARESVISSNTGTPALPKLKQPSFSSHRNGINPNLPRTLLKEIEVMVAAWQSELGQILQQIQEVYLEGPVLEGWLESAEDGKRQGEGTLKTTQYPLLGGYRLCGIDANGKLRSRSVPSSQVAEVSYAIARYQKLQQFLHRKQELENRLSELAEMLCLVQGHLQKR